MDNLIKVLEIFSRNWLIVLIVVLTIPLAKFAIRAYVDVKIAKLNKPNVLKLHVSNAEFTKTLEIASSQINLDDLNKHLNGEVYKKENDILLEKKAS